MGGRGEGRKMGRERGGNISKGGEDAGGRGSFPELGGLVWPASLPYICLFPLFTDSPGSP